MNHNLSGNEIGILSALVAAMGSRKPSWPGALVSRHSMDAFWSSARGCTFSHEAVCDETALQMIEDAATGRLKCDPLLRMYAGVLLLHSYMKGYHWNAANRPDVNVIIGEMTGLLSGMPTSVVFAFAEFISWCHTESGEVGDSAFFDVSAAVAFDELSSRCAKRAVEWTLRHDSRRTSDALQDVISTKWLLRLDWNASKTLLEHTWTGVFEQLRRTCMSGRGVEQLVSMWDRA